MSMITDELYERFKGNLENVNGVCLRSSTADAAAAIVELYKENGITTVCLAESPFMQEIGLAAALEAAGITVHTDHIRLNAETDKGGISEAQYGIADLGTLVQAKADVDCRIVATMSEYYVGIVMGSTIVPEYDDMFELIDQLPEIPSFVGFITGPSRTADIECVSTVGVHGPIRMAALVVDDK